MGLKSLKKWLNLSLLLGGLVSYRGGRDGGLGKEPVRLLKPLVPLVRLGRRALVDREIPLPTPDDVAVHVRVLEVGTLEGVDLSLQVGQRVLKVKTFRDFAFQIGKRDTVDFLMSVPRSPRAA